jgi:putative transcriptional regulator
MDLNPPFFLVAMPSMDDEYFGRGVVLIHQHDENGALGLLVNHPLVDEDEHPTQMTAEIKDLAGNVVFHITEDLLDGGPVNDESIFALHECVDVGTEQTSMGDDLYLETEPEVFQKLLESDERKSKRRFFLGCSQWAPGQLESEIRAGSWLLVPFDRRFLFDYRAGEDTTAEDIWKKVMLSGGVDPLTVMGQGSSDAGPN